MTFRLSVDIGGTFTDLAMYDEDTGEVALGKVPTTPNSPDEGCITAIRQMVTDTTNWTHFLHGTTVGLNALLERRGTVVGLLCTEGFRDILEIRRGSRSELDPLSSVPPPPLVPRYLRLGVSERTSASGEILRAVDSATVEAALEVFKDSGVGAVAVCLLNAYANPANEIEVARALRAAGFTGHISLSHAVSGEYRDYERTSTTAVDAYVQARMADYLDRIETGIRSDGFTGPCLIMRSGGGSMSFEEAGHRSFETIMSGPVAAAEGAAELSRVFSLGDLVTADVGGTSFDTCLIQNGRPQLLYQGEVAGLPIQAPWIDVRSIGAGGGSIAYVDAAGLLHVGPESAGAVPGPASYGRGGSRPTTTDAALHLGMLGKGELASGLILDTVAAAAALAEVGAGLGLNNEDLAAGIIRIASAAMANAIREITTEQGVDPRSLKLLAIGGAGPMLAATIARELEIGTIVVPPYAGNFSAWGLLGADVVREASRTFVTSLSDDSISALTGVAENLLKELSDGSEASASNVNSEISFDMRFAGQEHCVNVPIPTSKHLILPDVDHIRNDFILRYKTKFGIVPVANVEVTAVRGLIRTSLPLRKRSLRKSVTDSSAGEPINLYSFRKGRRVDGLAYNRAELPVGRQLRGPAVIYEDTATTYVDAGLAFSVDENFNLIITEEASNA
jgi:N-methylhydantoinase A